MTTGACSFRPVQGWGSSPVPEQRQPASPAPVGLC